MKNVTFGVLVLGFMICMAFQTHQAKTYSVSMTLEQWSMRINQLEYIKQQLRQSDLPSKQVALITDSVLSPIQSEISQQVQKQLTDEKAAQMKKDSTKPKK
jgi:hypothetical protein